MKITKIETNGVRPNFEAEFRYYDRNAVRTMGMIEEITGEMFHETYPDLQGEFESITETKVLPRLKVFTHKLFNEIDRLQGA